MTRVAINGLGRVGRAALRLCFVAEIRDIWPGGRLRAGSLGREICGEEDSSWLPPEKAGRLFPPPPRGGNRRRMPSEATWSPGLRHNHRFCHLISGTQH